MLTDAEGQGATMHHCTDRSGEWVHEVKPLSQVVPTANTVCLAGLGTIPEEKRAEAQKILDEVEIMPVGSKVASGDLFNCRTWLKMAIYQLDRARVIKLISDVGKYKLYHQMPHGRKIGKGRGLVNVLYCVDYLETTLRMLAGQIVMQRSQGRSSKVAAKVYNRA